MNEAKILRKRLTKLYLHMANTDENVQCSKECPQMRVMISINQKCLQRIIRMGSTIVHFPIRQNYGQMVQHPKIPILLKQSKSSLISAFNVSVLFVSNLN